MRLIRVILAIFVVLMTACTLRPMAQTIVTVNGQPITRGELEVRVAIFDLFNDQSQDLGRMVEDMISERLLSQQAGDMGISVTDIELAVEMERFFSSLEYRFQSRELAQNRLQVAGLTHDSIASFLQSYLVAQGVTAAVKDQVTVSSEEIRAFYDEHRDDLYTFRSPPTRAWQIVLPVGQDTLVEQILLKARAGGDFADLARGYSIDTASARRGGDLGYLTPVSAPPEIAETIFGITPGEIHGPIVGPNGLLILRVTQPLEAGTIPFETAQDEVINRILPDKQDQEYTAWFSTLREGAKITRPTKGRLSLGKNE